MIQKYRYLAPLFRVGNSELPINVSVVYIYFSVDGF